MRRLVELLHYRNAVHYLAGALTALGALVSWSLVVTGALIFLAYQLIQDRHTGDTAYPDIREFAIGYFTVCAIMIVRTLVLQGG